MGQFSHAFSTCIERDTRPAKKLFPFSRKMRGLVNLNMQSIGEWPGFKPTTLGSKVEVYPTVGN